MADEVKAFVPRDPLIELVDEYPELQKISGVENLSDRQVRFCWYFACVSSPYYKMRESERWRKAAAAVFDKKHSEFKKYSAGDYPDTLKPLIKFFSSVKPNARIRIKLVAERMFHNIEETTFSFDPADEESDNSAFIATSQKAIEVLPKLLEIIEDGGMGIRTVQKRSNKQQGEDVLIPNMEDINV